MHIGLRHSISKQNQICKGEKQEEMYGLWTPRIRKFETGMRIREFFILPLLPKILKNQEILPFSITKT